LQKPLVQAENDFAFGFITQSSNWSLSFFVEVAKLSDEALQHIGYQLLSIDTSDEKL
jgi:hypothetical protein